MGGLSDEPILDPHVPQTEGLQISDHRLSTSCGVVKRADHHCGDDHVYDYHTDSFNLKQIQIVTIVISDMYVVPAFGAIDGRTAAGGTLDECAQLFLIADYTVLQTESELPQPACPSAITWRDIAERYQQAIVDLR